MNKHLYLCHLLVLSSPTLMMHGHTNLKLASAKQANEIFDFKNLKRRLHKTTAAVWFNKSCRSKTIDTYIHIHQDQQMNSSLHFTFSLCCRLTPHAVLYREKVKCRDVSTPHILPMLQANTTRGFIQSILLTMGIMMPESCSVNLL